MCEYAIAVFYLSLMDTLTMWSAFDTFGVWILISHPAFVLIIVYLMADVLSKLSSDVSSQGIQGSYEGVAGTIVDLRNRLCLSVSDYSLCGDTSASVGERGYTAEGFSSMTEAKSSTLKCLTQSAIKTGCDATADLVRSGLISHLIRTVRSIYQYNLKEVRL